MSWVTIIWSMIASVSFTLATIYLLIWFRERRSWAYLCFFVLAAGVIGMATGEMAAMYAKSPAAYGAAIRWGHFAYGFIAVGSLGFVHFYFGTGKRWLLGAALGERTGELHLALASDLEDPDFAPCRSRRNISAASSSPCAPWPGKTCGCCENN